ncbi:RPM1-interacting protein 4-like isoform X2 [Asparagus officinalis]|uniref:RPM1-interacting protein 4-like isoform X2 n=1 Tax=Asparagus officinalis TaxID=4686 RepID=UPI00098DF137|nr:RPM1-interacting protein 4-like isoform X2 [Asparagus officinalis]
MSKSAHVPKFGNWDSDNVPYTKYFENARKDKIPRPKNFNPNDPEQNPDAFLSGIFPSEQELKNNGSEIHSVVNKKTYQGDNMELRERSKQRRNSDEDSLHIPPLQQSGPRQGRASRTDAMHETPSVPKFGVWDEKGPKSGDGFTVIFNKVKQEKQNAASKFPRVPIDPTIHPSKRKNRANPASRSKWGFHDIIF